MPDQAPVAGAQPQPQQPPFGASPVSQPAPNRGYEAAALQKLGLIGKQLTEILNLTGVTSDIGKEVLKMLQSVSKLTPPDANPAVEKRNIESMAMRNAQQNQAMQALKQAMAGGGQGAGGSPPAAAGGMPPGGGAAMPKAA